MTGHSTRSEGREFARLVRSAFGQHVLDGVAHRIAAVHHGKTLGAFHMGILDVARGILAVPATATTTR